MSEYIIGNDGDESILDLGKFELRFQEREEIVRCRDCKYYILDEFGTAECHWFTDYYSQPVHSPEPDGFCAWGERK